MTPNEIAILIGGIGTIVAAILTLVMKAYSLFKEIRMTIKDNDWTTLLELIDILVEAAQKTLDKGTEKKQYVIDNLSKRGYEIDEIVDAAIEASVYNLQN